ncbi:hypothetical protein DPX16_16552 [Anabarilius grahami]|uniref:Uncharacterized protein n=1 Tax=Anabarilius grahami TaxID=495550 RepID=A0A3N0XV14_ANAGA|nr:hypothetical protein DPX16_16552 [Anabarilius grahami]
MLAKCHRSLVSLDYISHVPPVLHTCTHFPRQLPIITDHLHLDSIICTPFILHSLPSLLVRSLFMLSSCMVYSALCSLKCYLFVELHICLISTPATVTEERTLKPLDFHQRDGDFPLLPGSSFSHASRFHDSRRSYHRAPTGWSFAGEKGFRISVCLQSVQKHGWPGQLVSLRLPPHAPSENSLPVPRWTHTPPLGPESGGGGRKQLPAKAPDPPWPAKAPDPPWPAKAHGLALETSTPTHASPCTGMRSPGRPPPLPVVTSTA